MIPYNPSSFNSNKTILEQILELKNWLKDHPQYEVYYCNDNASLYPFVNTFSLANVPDNTNMDIGDLVVCNNAAYCTVISIDRDNGLFTAGYGVSFKGDTGAAGQQGYSLRVSSENYVDDVTAYHRNSLEPSHGTRENDTILFANGYVGIVTSLGAGATYYVTNRTVSFVGPQGPQGPTGPTGATGPQGPTGPAGADGNDGVSITNVTIDGNSHLIVTLSDGNTIDAGSVASSLEGADIQSTGATAGQVLTADGSNGASWQTPQSSGIEVVTITSNTGTFSNDDFNKIANKDAVIKWDNGTFVTLLYKIRSSDSYIYYSTYQYNNQQNLSIGYYCTIEISTKAYTCDLKINIIKKDNINSETATNGQVLTANGNGGASWKNAGGGSTLNVYNFSKQLNTDANRKQLYNIIDNAKSIKYIEDDDGKTYNIHAGLNQFRIIGFDAFASGVTKYVYILNKTGTSTSGTAYNADGTSSSISISGRIFECKYYNDSEITS